MTRRSLFEIRMDVLNEVVNTEMPTRIMYKANLSWDALKKALKFLIDKKLVRTKIKYAKTGDMKSSNMYYITPKGVAMLRRIKPDIDLMRS